MQPEQTPNVQETIVPVQAVTETPEQEAAPKNSKDWERFREARAQERKRAEELAIQAEKSRQEAAALRAALDASLNKPQQQSYDYGHNEETNEQIIEKKVLELMTKREQEAIRLRQEQELKELPQVLARNHENFDQICSTENLDYLEFHHPEIAVGFKYMPDGYDKWSAIYKAVKKFVPNTNSGNDMKKAERNLQKPQSVSAPVVGTPGQSLPVVLDEARRAANWERMQKTLKGLN